MCYGEEDEEEEDERVETAIWNGDSKTDSSSSPSFRRAKSLSCSGRHTSHGKHCTITKINIKAREKVTFHQLPNPAGFRRSANHALTMISRYFASGSYNEHEYALNDLQRVKITNKNIKSMQSI